MRPMSSPGFQLQSVGELQARLEAERSGSPFLLFRDGDGRQQLVRLPADGAEVVIGRNPDHGIELAWDPQVSRVHAVLERVGGVWTVEDDGLSRNGTAVNGVPLSGRRRLRDEDVPTWYALTHMSLTGFVCMLGLGGISTSIAYWLWGRLLRDHPAAQVVPFALLVPFVGSAASSIVFGEKFGTLRLAGMLTVIGGIAIMLFSKRPQALPKAAGA